MFLHCYELFILYLPGVTFSGYGFFPGRVRMRVFPCSSQKKFPCFLFSPPAKLVPHKPAFFSGEEPVFFLGHSRSFSRTIPCRDALIPSSPSFLPVFPFQPVHPLSTPAMWVTLLFLRRTSAAPASLRGLASLRAQRRVIGALDSHQGVQEEEGVVEKCFEGCRAGGKRGEREERRGREGDEGG